jgi:hypothetical protein
MGECGRDGAFTLDAITDSMVERIAMPTFNSKAATTIADDRALTDEERGVVRWLLENGEQRAPRFLTQLASARVSGRCSCGCASIDFSIAGSQPVTDGEMDILADYAWRDTSGHLFGAFVFARSGLLAGLDLWSIDGEATATRLPHSHELTPIENI